MNDDVTKQPEPEPEPDKTPDPMPAAQQPDAAATPAADQTPAAAGPAPIPPEDQAAQALAAPPYDPAIALQEAIGRFEREGRLESSAALIVRHLFAGLLFQVRGFLSETISSNPYLQALGQAGGGAGYSPQNQPVMPQAGQQLGTSQPPLGAIPGGDLASSIAWKLDKYRGPIGKDGPTANVDAFLHAIDLNEAPGFVRENWPAIQAYIASQPGAGWGEEGLQRAGFPIAPEAGPLQTILDMNPAGPLGRYIGGQLGFHPPVPFTTSSYFLNALRNRWNGDVSLTGIQSGGAMGRAKLRNLMAERAAQGQ
jgi:hypothetical protein